MASFDVDVDHGSLLYQAKIWSDQGEELLSIANEASRNEYSGQAGFLGEAVNAYNEACADMGKLCSQGGVEMAEISQELLGSHGNYLRVEQQVVRIIQDAISGM